MTSTKPRRGYGDLIARARIDAGLSPEALAERLGKKSKGIVYRLESEEQEPDVETINRLVAG